MDSMFKVGSYVCAGPQPGFLKPEETYTDYVMLGVETGSFDYGIGDVNGQASFGDIVLIPIGTPFRRKSHGDISFHLFQFSPYSENDTAAEIPTGKISIGDVNRLTSTYAYLRKIWQERGHDSRKAGLVRHLLMDLLQMCDLERQNAMKRKKNTDPLMQKAAGLIHRNLFGEMSMNQIASSLGIKQSELTRRFRLAYEVAPVEYATRLRLEEVKRLLRETDDTLDAIAANSGYENGSYLSRVFRAKVGITPSAFRKYNQL